MIIDIIKNVDHSKKGEEIRSLNLSKILFFIEKKLDFFLNVLFICLIEKSQKFFYVNDLMNIPLIKATEKIHILIMIFEKFMKFFKIFLINKRFLDLICSIF